MVYLRCWCNACLQYEWTSGLFNCLGAQELKNGIFYNSLKENPKICRIARLCGEMLKNAENIVLRVVCKFYIYRVYKKTEQI